jgi:hypothetical protein
MTEPVRRATTVEAVDRLINLWHTQLVTDLMSRDDLPDPPPQAWDYLGWTEEEYNNWVETGQIPKE